MEAAIALRVPAVEVRDRLAVFVEGVTGPFALRVQRENALSRTGFGGDRFSWFPLFSW
jgi:hypothetical protein